MDSQKEEKIKTIGYNIGKAMVYTFEICFISIIIGLTIKFLLWLF